MRIWRSAASSLSAIARDRRTLVMSLTWATLNWLLDAASLWCFVAAFGRFVNPVELFSAYGITGPVDLNGRQFIASPYADGATVQVSGGVARVPTGPGLGVEVDESIVRELAVDVLAAKP